MLNILVYHCLYLLLKDRLFELVKSKLAITVNEVEIDKAVQMKTLTASPW